MKGEEVKGRQGEGRGGKCKGQPITACPDHKKTFSARKGGKMAVF